MVNFPNPKINKMFTPLRKKFEEYLQPLVITAESLFTNPYINRQDFKHLGVYDNQYDFYVVKSDVSENELTGGIRYGNDPSEYISVGHMSFWNKNHEFKMGPIKEIWQVYGMALHAFFPWLLNPRNDLMDTCQYSLADLKSYIEAVTYPVYWPKHGDLIASFKENVLELGHWCNKDYYMAYDNQFENWTIIAGSIDSLDHKKMLVDVYQVKNYINVRDRKFLIETGLTDVLVGMILAHRETNIFSTLVEKEFFTDLPAFFVPDEPEEMVLMESLGMGLRIWNPTAEPIHDIDKSLFPNYLSGADYNTVHDILGTSGCSKKHPYWDWQVMALVKTSKGDQIVCPGDYIVEVNEDTILVLDRETFWKVFKREEK